MQNELAPKLAPGSKWRDAVLEDYLGTVCSGCGRPKVKCHSFCGRCYFSLPKSMRSGLYARMGSGYERAFADAREFLSGEIRGMTLPIPAPENEPENEPESPSKQFARKWARENGLSHEEENELVENADKGGSLGHGYGIGPRRE
jgi:hypothetical protein